MNIQLLTGLGDAFNNFMKQKKQLSINTQTATDNGLEQKDLKNKKWFKDPNNLDSIAALGSAGISGLINFSTINNSGASSSIKDMAKADAGLETVASGLSALGPWGTAAGLALKGFNTIGAGLVSTPQAYKNFHLNNNVANSSSMGGVANNAKDMSQTIDSFNQSGLIGRLFGKKASSRNKANNLMQKQSDASNILDDNKKAFEQATTSTDLFSLRNQFNLNGLNSFSNLQIGKSGLKFKKPIKAQEGVKLFNGLFKPATIIKKQNVTYLKSNKQNTNKEQTNNQNSRQFNGINVADNKVKKFSADKKAEFENWKAQQNGSVVQGQTKPIMNNNNPVYNNGVPLVQKQTVQNIIPTKTITSTQAGTPVQGKVANNVKPVGVVQNTNLPQKNNIVNNVKAKPIRSTKKPMETVSDLWQKVTGTSWAEAKMQGLTDGSLRNNLAILKRLRAGENPLETSRLAKEQLIADKKAKVTELANAAIQRSLSRGIIQPTPIINSESLETLKRGGVVQKKSTNEQIELFKTGGKVGPKNVIVSGALHAHKHDLKSIDGFSDAEITLKGVPVVTFEEGGVVAQHAEVEREEIIFHLEFTDKLEELAKLGTDEAKIEAGKLLVKEILTNTKDSDTKVLKNT